jgi:hypothetical protein
MVAELREDVGYLLNDGVQTKNQNAMLFYEYIFPFIVTDKGKLRQKQSTYANLKDALTLRPPTFRPL